MLCRDTPWNPSQPAMKSHSRSLGHAALSEGHLGRGAGYVVEVDVLRLFNDPSAVAFPDPVQFLGDRGLAM